MDKDLTVPEMAELANVSEDKVRQWCKRGLIEGAWNSGDGSRECWRVPPDAWAKFRMSRVAQQRQIATEIVARRAKSGRNLLGV